ncbi:hypothetical protein D9C73_028601 [Collichthys lucidus]|uniref:Uncharacterized protein n=1 Tax=Collichthys lucidus TaxID=240159 RepID=A0A4U5TV75_COLLU|nr:hypothetical protein D9C73_028601 [Collichthys lucidus]
MSNKWENLQDAEMADSFLQAYNTCRGSFQGVCGLCVTYESLEEVALEDVDDPLDGVSELPVLGVLQLGPVLLEQQQSSLCIWATGGSSSR